MRVFLVVATTTDLPIVQRILNVADISVSTVDDVPTDCPWVTGLASALEPCAAVAAVPFGPGMATVLRVIGAAARLGKPFVTLVPARADRDQLPFSMRAAPVIGLHGETTATSNEIVHSLRSAVALDAPQASLSPWHGRIDPFPDELTLPIMLNATRVLKDDAVQLSKRTQPPDFEAPYRASLFPAEIKGWGTLRFTVDDLAHALFTTGRAPGDRMRYGPASLWEVAAPCIINPRLYPTASLWPARPVSAGVGPGSLGTLGIILRIGSSGHLGVLP
jgi:hypothetical protein